MKILDIIHHWTDSGIRGSFDEVLYRKIQILKRDYTCIMPKPQIKK